MDIKTEIRLGGAGAGRGPHLIHISHYPDDSQILLRCDCGWSGSVSMPDSRVALSRDDHKVIGRAINTHRAWVRVKQNDFVPINWEFVPEVRELRSLR